MATRFVSERNIKFMLYEVFDAEGITHYPYYEEHNRNTFDMILKEGIRLSRDLLYPVLEEMDRTPPDLINGEVKVHPSVNPIIKEFAEGGWMSISVPFEYDGEQIPHIIDNTCHFIFGAANYSASAYAQLTKGSSNLIETFGSKTLFNTYVTKMRSGEWQGTMALTEPEAGSSLADIASSATPTDEDYYLIRGQKVFISAGDHDGVENIVHLLLAKIDGAPSGVKGISLFVVPKKRLQNDGTLIPNDVICSGVYHKLGYRGCPITQLSFGDKNDCRGWLVGKPHNGLRYMFQMMNEARIDVGIGAAAIASAAYYASLEYSKSRHQGRKVEEKNPEMPQVPIIEHADIKRMLLFQKAVVEGSFSLILQTSLYMDMLKVMNREEGEKYHLLLEILTPIVKTYPSEMAVHSVSQGLQCLGGSGYCDDYPLEQYFRDSRIHPIHEGTTGIQGIDLLGRKVVMNEGRAFQLFTDEVTQAIERAGEIDSLKKYADELSNALSNLHHVTDHLQSLAESKGKEASLADATLYLEYFCIITIAWQWLLQGIAASKACENNPKEKDLNFYQGKMMTLRYYFVYELVKANALEKRLLDIDPVSVEMKKDYFND